jgi:hypothetical protein
VIAPAHPGQDLEQAELVDLAPGRADGGRRHQDVPGALASRTQVHRNRVRSRAAVERDDHRPGPLLVVVFRHVELRSRDDRPPRRVSAGRGVVSLLVAGGERSGDQ